MEATINIATDGTIRAVYFDGLADCFQDCPMQIKRASQVEYNAEKRQWEVRFTWSPEVVAYSHASRAECIRWEVEYLNQNLDKL